MTVETATPFLHITPTAPEGYRYFEFPTSAEFRFLFVYDPTVWRFVEGQGATDLRIEGGKGLAHRSIADCQIYENFGRGFDGTIREERRGLAPDIFLIRSFFSADGLLRFIVFEPAGIHLSVPQYGWPQCKTDAEEALRTYTPVPIGP